MSQTMKMMVSKVFMKNSTARTLFSLLALPLLASCGGDEGANDKEEERIRPASVTEIPASNGFRRARVYKGDWRPLIECRELSDESTLLFDLWDGTVTVATSSNGQRVTSPSPEIFGKPLGTNRSWLVHGVPTRLGPTTMKLQLDSFGKGHVFVSRLNPSCREGFCSNWVAQFNCTERPIAYEQRFVEAACTGDDRYVDQFMDQYPNTSVYINQIGVIGETALTCALKGGYRAVVRQLLSRRNSGLDFSAGNLKGETALLVDLDLGRGFGSEWIRREDVDANRVDILDRTIYHTRGGGSLTFLAEQMSNARVNKQLLNVVDQSGTTGAGAVVNRLFGSHDAISAVELMKFVPGFDIEKPAIDRNTYLETAITRKSPLMAKYFFLMRPKQRISSADPRQLLLLAASSCDQSFISTLDQRTDIEYNLSLPTGENAIDIVRRERCANSDALISILSSRGTVDRQDPVATACRGDVGSFSNALQNGARIGSRTDAIFQCIWNKPDLLRVTTKFPDAGWDWFAIETYIERVIESNDATLTSLYLSEMRWRETSGLIQKLKNAVLGGKLTGAQYVAALSNQRSLNNNNLRFGKYGHLMFDLIESADTATLTRIMQAISEQAWPTFDLSSQVEALAHYASLYEGLTQNAGCQWTPNGLTEDVLRFAIRLGKTDIALMLARALSSARVRVEPLRVSCGSQGPVVMNPVHLSVKTCSAELVLQVIGLTTSLIEGTGENKKTRVSVLDAIARAQACTSDQALRMLQVSSSSILRNENELAMDGVHSQTIAKQLTQMNLVVKPVLTPFVTTPQHYNAASISAADEPTPFSRRDGRVEMAVRTILGKVGTSGTWLDYRPQATWTVTFKGLTEVVVFNSFSAQDLAKKGSCLVIKSSGRLVMRDGGLDFTKITVCPTSLRITFNTTTPENALPIKDHVDGDFQFSLEGLPIEQ